MYCGTKARKVKNKIKWKCPKCKQEFVFEDIKEVNE
jgi:predicted Zn-ribbon and HTH transcriptional regulator